MPIHTNQKMRIVVELKTILSLWTEKNKTLATLKKKLEDDNDFRHSLATKYAIRHKLHNGATLEFPEHGYRNHNLLFWDAQNKMIVDTFDKIDDYGSVPPRFVVGDGYFNPNDWLDEVEHNSFVFPARPLINEMKELVEQYPDESTMIVTINGHDYKVFYNREEMQGMWDFCILDVCSPYEFLVYPGEPEWRETIVD